MKIDPIPAKKTTSRMKLLLAMPYEGHWIYVRKIGHDMFMWDAVYDGQLYSSYIIVSPNKGRKTLTKAQQNTAMKVCFAGAVTTIDMKLGKKLDKATQKRVESFERNRKLHEEREAKNAKSLRKVRKNGRKGNNKKT